MHLQPPVTPDLLPSFVISVFNDAKGIALQVHTPEDPSIRKHASLGLLYGLAILFLDDMGMINATIDKLLANGPMNEVDAMNRIAGLLETSH